MKRFLPWFVLCLVSWLTSLFASLCFSIVVFLFELISELSTLWKVIIYLFGGTTFLAIVFLPVCYGSVLALRASESVKSTKKGTRYLALSICMLISNAIYIFQGIREYVIHIDKMIMCVYYIVLLIAGLSIAREIKYNNENKDPSYENEFSPLDTENIDAE